MFEQKKVIESEKLDGIIDTMLDKLKDAEAGSKEYAVLTDQLSKLYRIKETNLTLQTKAIETLSKQAETASKIESNDLDNKIKKNESESKCKLNGLDADIKEKELNNRFGVKPDTLALIAGNLAGIAIILSFEQVNVITSKALGFVAKLR
jgi:hypothetical protein